MGTLWALEWLNQNANRNYPLTEDATRVDQTGTFTVPQSFVLELDLPVHAGMDVDPGQFFILSIGAYATGYSVLVGYQPAAGGTPVPVATALINANTFTRYSQYALGGVSPFDDTVGKLVIGTLDDINEQPPGLWTFNFANARLEPDAIRPMIRGVSSLVCVNGGQSSIRLQGDVMLTAGSNCQLVPVAVEGQNPEIIINFIQGEGTVSDCICTGGAAPTNPITSIDGIVPTPAGNFYLLGSDCITLTPIQNGLQIVDTCATPCCGCPELEAITTALEALGVQAATVQQFVNQLQDAVNTMSMTVLGAKLNDQTCLTCS